MQNTSTIFRNFFIITILFTSCEPKYSDLITSPELLPASLITILNPAADSQYVILTTGQPPWGEINKIYERELVLFSQARIILKSEKQTLSFCHRFTVVNGNKMIPKFYNVSVDPIIPGETYYLDVDIPHKGHFSAQTTVPGDFRIIAPVSGDSVPIKQPISVTWTPAKKAVGYRISIWINLTLQWTNWPDTTKTIQDAWWSMGEKYSYPDTGENLNLEHRLMEIYPISDYIKDVKKAILYVEALDEAAWNAYHIAIAEKVHPSEYRLDVVDYSNIERGYGLMTATNTQSIELELPKE
ncbi:DUF4249 family protein [candidate division KSB1 bacterium]|nr:DUF4249 family protein [candidate division KSB1 bacterium]